MGGDATSNIAELEGEGKNKRNTDARQLGRCGDQSDNDNKTLTEQKRTYVAVSPDVPQNPTEAPPTASTLSQGIVFRLLSLEMFPQA